MAGAELVPARNPLAHENANSVRRQTAISGLKRPLAGFVLTPFAVCNCRFGSEATVPRRPAT